MLLLNVDTQKYYVCTEVRVFVGNGNPKMSGKFIQMRFRWKSNKKWQLSMDSIILCGYFCMKEFLGDCVGRQGKKRTNRCCYCWIKWRSGLTSMWCCDRMNVYFVYNSFLNFNIFFFFTQLFYDFLLFRTSQITIKVINLDLIFYLANMIPFI